MVKMLFPIRLLSTFLQNIHTLWDSSNLPKTRPEPFIAPYTEHATVIGISTTIVLSVLRITASDYLFGLFRLFLQTIIILVNCLFGVLFQTWAEYVISGAVVLIPITVACSVYGAMNGSGLVFGRLELSHNV
jgi:hypothetical protein